MASYKVKHCDRHIAKRFITSLAKEVMFFVALVCLFVDIIQKVMNGLG